MQQNLLHHPRWYQLVLYTLGGIAVGLALGVILWY
jgi:hypothetical protein